MIFRPSLIGLLCLLLIPFVELYLIIKVGSAIGALLTILLLILIGALGGLMARREGVKTLAKLERRLHSGADASFEFLDAGVLFLCGLLFLFPGFITDLIALLLLLPPTRWLLLRAFFSGVFTRTSGSDKLNSGVKEGEFRDLD